MSLTRLNTLCALQLVLALRRALASEDWAGVQRVLATAEKRSLARIARPELQMAQDAMNNRVVEARLVSALTTSRWVHV